MRRTAFAAMGTTVEIGGAHPPDDAAAQLFSQYEQVFSPFRDTSELTALNRAHGSFVKISPLLAAGLGAALRAAALTGGLVDPTVGGALVSAGLYAERRGGSAPRPFDRSELTIAGGLARVPRGCLLDLNGVVKGMAVDAALASCPDAAFVSAGGDIATRVPLTVALPGGGTVRLERGALATSGSSRRRWRHAGRLEHHLIDPRTGEASVSPWREVTACGATCLDADIAAKAGFLAGADGPAWLAARGIPARFVDHGGAISCNAPWCSSHDRGAACT